MNNLRAQQFHKRKKTNGLSGVQKKELELADEEDFGSDCFGKWRSWLWNTMEYPWTSQAASYDFEF